MATVTVTVNGRRYPIACDEGEEEHVSKLASYVDDKVSELSGSVGQIGDAQLLLMASLLVADELSDALHDLAAARGSGAGAGGDGLAGRLNAMAAQIEDIAGRLERS
jgi:cell division protein ZapA